MADLTVKLGEHNVSRRAFVGAAALGTLAVAGLTGCDNKIDDPVVDDPAKPIPTVELLEGGKWVTFNCTTPTCAYRCHNMAYVVDGNILRQGTGNVHEDSVDYPQMRPCAKGLSTRRFITSAARLKYPMKRKNWKPGGVDFHPELRGIDEWERISWDEAIKYATDEYVRIRDTYGNKSMLSLGELEVRMVPGLIGSPILNALGGCLTTWGQASQGGFPVVARNMRGAWSSGQSDSQDRIALRHSKLIVLWGTNPAWTASGGNMYHFLNAKRIGGAKVIIVDPYFHNAAQSFADEWIPCRPGTDGALLEALAYVIIKNNWQDQDFLDKHCLGFDAEHMPSDAKVNENFKDYILGKYDGTPKTPEYASKICGTPVALIEKFAEEIAKTKPMAWKSSGAPARTYYGNRYAQLFFTLGWMTGSVGVLGAETSAGASHPNSQLGTPSGKGMVAFGYPGYSYPANPICTEPRAGSAIQNGLYKEGTEYGIPFSQTFKAIVDGYYNAPGPNNVQKPLDVRCIVRDTMHQPTNQQTGGAYTEKAFRKSTVEFVLVQDRFSVPDAQYADIVLPVTTTLEEELSPSYYCTAEETLLGRKVIEPYFESKPDPEIFYAMCDKLGIGEDKVKRVAVRQAQFNKIAAATILAEDGSRKPLVTITQADMDKYGFTGTPVEGGVVSFEDFLENGGYQLPRKDNDHYMNIFDKAFVADPEGSPVATTSGKYEIYCQSLKDYYDKACFNDIDPLPKYKASPEGAEEAATKSDYCFQLVTQHIIRHSHSSFANVRQLDEIFPVELWMSKVDADKRGFKKGDWVLATNTAGAQVVRRVNVIPHLMPGVIIMGQGNWRKFDQKTGIDMGGNTNTLCRTVLLGDGYQCYNTNLIKVERYTGETPTPDYKTDPVGVNL